MARISKIQQLSDFPEVSPRNFSIPEHPEFLAEWKAFISFQCVLSNLQRDFSKTNQIYSPNYGNSNTFSTENHSLKISYLGLCQL